MFLNFLNLFLKGLRKPFFVLGVWSSLYHSEALWAQKVKNSFNLPPLLRQTERYYQGIPAMGMEFRQILWNELLQENEESTGKLWLSRVPLKRQLSPHKATTSFSFRWEVVKPLQQVYMSNGELFTSYVLDPRGERTNLVQESATEIQSPLLESLLAGQFSNLPQGSWIPGGSQQPFLFSFLINPGTAGSISSFSLLLEPHQKKIIELQLRYVGGNISKIYFKNFKIYKNLPTSLFQEDLGLKVGKNPKTS